MVRGGRKLKNLRGFVPLQSLFLDHLLECANSELVVPTPLLLYLYLFCPWKKVTTRKTLRPYFIYLLYVPLYAFLNFGEVKQTLIQEWMVSMSVASSSLSQMLEGGALQKTSNSNVTSELFYQRANIVYELRRTNWIRIQWPCLERDDTQEH